MSQPAKRNATYQDVLALPEDLIGEVIAGELYTSPRPAPAHILVASNLGSEIQNPFQRGHQGPGGWWILDEPEIHLVQDILVPDLAGWRKERMPTVPTQGAFRLAPDWVCEILSPSTRRKDRMIKLPAYARHGVNWAWLVDPVAREIEVFELGDQGWLLRGGFVGDEKAAIPPFDAAELDVSRIWEGLPAAKD